MTRVYPSDFIHAEVCYNCYSLFNEFCVRRNTAPTDASIHKFGCDAFFNAIDPNGNNHSCFNCTLFRRDFCTKQKRVVENLEEETCKDFIVTPYFKEHPTGLMIVCGKKKRG